MTKPILLQRHPASVSTAATLPVWVARSGDALLATYRIPGDSSGIVFPSRRDPSFRDNLWEHTCFELFVRLPGSRDYLEFNFSPSQEWAAYHLDAYREGMKRATVGVAKIVVTPWKNRFELSVQSELPREWARSPLQLNLSAVLEERGGSRSYWALAHPAGDPDFHDPDCFQLELPAARSA